MDHPSDTVSIKGNLIIIKTDKDGVEEITRVPNLVVTNGKSHIINRLAANTWAPMSHMSVGTGATAAQPGDTALGTEVGRVTLSSSTPNQNTITYVGTFGTGVGTGQLTEAGIFNVANVMLCRTVFPSVNKTISDSITITWVVSIT